MLYPSWMDDEDELKALASTMPKEKTIPLEGIFPQPKEEPEEEDGILKYGENVINLAGSVPILLGSAAAETAGDILKTVGDAHSSTFGGKETTASTILNSAGDFANMIGRFEKRLHDLELTRIISLQMAPQIRLVQNNNTVMVEKIQSTIVNTIPLWKSQMVIALGLAHSEQALQAQQAVTNMTNDLLKKNAERLHQTTVGVAREAERGVVDLETLVHTNQELISTLDEVQQIQKEGRERRHAAEAELGRMEKELKEKLLNIGP